MVNKRKPVNRGDSSWQAYSHYKNTKNILYAVLAIGEEPSAPPAWAIEACKDYYAVAKISHLDIVIKKRVVAKSDIDDKLLEEVTRLMFSEDITEHAAIHKALGKDANEANVRRLQRKRSTEIQHFEGEHGEIDEDDPRTKRQISERVPPQSRIFRKNPKP